MKHLPGLLAASLPPLALVALTAAPAAAQSQRPKYQLIRQNEDWSFLADPAQRTDCWDRFKYMPLDDDGDVWAGIGGELQLRYEVWDDFNFGAPPAANHDDDFLLTRARLHGDLHVGERFRAFGELKVAQATDRDLPGGRRPLDQDTFDIQQVFVDYTFDVGDEDSLRLRGGRQMLQFGVQRLVSPLPWGNTLRAWDGLTAALTHGSWNVTGIATAFVPVDKTDFNEADDDMLLYGVYAQKRHTPKNGLDLYWLGATRPDVTVNGTSGDSKRQTLGARRFAPLGGGFDGEVEVAYQFGEVGDGDVSAWSFASQLGYTPDGGALRHWLGLDWASGDDGAGGDVETFDQLYPLGHAYFGYIDAVGRQNIVDTSLGSTWKASPKLGLSLGGHSFWLASKDDALYNAGGGVARAPGSFDSSWVGWEVDAVATYKPAPHVSTQLGICHFFAGDALEDSGPSEDVDFVYLSLGYTF